MIVKDCTIAQVEHSLIRNKALTQNAFLDYTVFEGKT